MKKAGALWAAGVVLALAAGVGIAIWRAPRTIEVPADPISPSVVAPPSAPKPPPSRSMPAPPDLAAVPPGVSAEQWAALRAEYADRPAELRRLAEHYAFADRLDRFRRARTAGRSAEQAALARALDEGLDERLRQRELSAGEARLIKIAVLDVLVGDADERQAALGRWETALAPAPPDAARVALEADFQRRQAAIVAAWRALPADRRDPRALERELDALRQTSFDRPPTHNAGAP